MLAPTQPPSRSPIVVAVYDQSRSRVDLFAASGKAFRRIASGGLAGNGATLGLAADRRRVVTVAEDGAYRTAVWEQRVAGARLGPARRVPSLRQAATVLATGDGRFLAASKFGTVAWALPYRPPAKPDVGSTGSTNVTLALGGGRNRYLYGMVSHGLMGDEPWSSFGVGRLSGRAAREEAWGAEDQREPRTRAALDVPARRELWTFDGERTAVVWRRAGRTLERASTTIALPSVGIQAATVRPGLFALWDATARLCLGRVTGSVWRDAGQPAQLPPGEVDETVELRVVRGGSALILASASTGTVWTIPILDGRSLGAPRRLFHTARRCVFYLSY